MSLYCAVDRDCLFLASNVGGEPRQWPERGTSGGCWRRLQCVVRCSAALPARAVGFRRAGQRGATAGFVSWPCPLSWNALCLGMPCVLNVFRLGNAFRLGGALSWRFLCACGTQPLINRPFCPDNMILVEFSGSFARCLSSANGGSLLGVLS